MKNKLTDEEKRIKRNEAVARYRERNKEKLKEKNRAYIKTDAYKEKHRIKMSEWRKQNPEKAREISRKHYELNKEKYNSKKRELLKNNKDFANKVREREQRYKATGRRAEMHKKRYNEKADEIRLKSKLWKQENKDKVSNYSRQYRDKYWLDHQKEQRNKLENCYVIAVLKKQSGYSIKTEDIPQSLIEVKKQSLKLKRNLKRINNDRYNTKL